MWPKMMQNHSWHKTHPDFKLNGVHYEYNELQEVGYSLIKDGDDYEKHIGEFILDWVTNKPTVEVYTSGSTGKPKKIEIKKLHMVNSAVATGKYFGLTASNSALLCLSCSGIAGKTMLVRAMVLGLELKSVEPSLAPLMANSSRFDFAAMVPLQVENSLKQLSQIKTLIIGGAPISLKLREALKTTPNAIYETYGMTETITHVAVKQISKSKFQSPSSSNPKIQQSDIQDSNFTALSNVSFSQDTRDCLVINAPNVSDQEVVTNDIVDLTSETTFEWLGRYDSVINSGGIKLIPERIEQKISALIEARFFVAGIPDESLGQKLVLLVESEEIQGDDLLAQIKNLEGLSKYEVPKEVIAIKPFKVTSSGKIHREKTLRQIP